MRAVNRYGKSKPLIVNEPVVAKFIAIPRNLARKEIQQKQWKKVYFCLFCELTFNYKNKHKPIGLKRHIIDDHFDGQTKIHGLEWIDHLIESQEDNIRNLEENQCSVNSQITTLYENCVFCFKLIQSFNLKGNLAEIPHSCIDSNGHSIKEIKANNYLCWKCIYNYFSVANQIPDFDEFHIYRHLEYHPFCCKLRRVVQEVNSFRVFECQPYANLKTFTKHLEYRHNLNVNGKDVRETYKLKRIEIVEKAIESRKRPKKIEVVSIAESDSD